MLAVFLVGTRDEKIKMGGMYGPIYTKDKFFKVLYIEIMCLCAGCDWFFASSIFIMKDVYYNNLIDKRCTKRESISIL